MKYNDKEYRLELTGYTLVLYKQEFHKDMLTTMTKFSKNLDVVSYFEILWALAKSGNKDFPNYNEFVRSMSDIKYILSEENMNEITETFRRCTEHADNVKKN